jgi:hypothetical protein
MEHLNFTSETGIFHNGVAEYSNVGPCSIVYTDVSKVPQSFKTSVTVYNSIRRNVVETVFLVNPHVYVNNCVRLLIIIQNDFVTDRQSAVSKAYEARLDLVNAGVQVTKQGMSETT